MEELQCRVLFSEGVDSMGLVSSSECPHFGQSSCVLSAEVQENNTYIELCRRERLVHRNTAV